MNNWKVIDGKLTKQFSFLNFEEAVKFVNKVAVIAETYNHHPDVLIHAYKQVTIMLFTHSANAITEKDDTLAKEIDRLY
jgi:4a-hydroxytetrahydrobiopterin dehydratase